MNNHFFKIFLILTVILFFTFLGKINFAQADFNSQINYQGKLTSSSSIPVADGGKCLRFSIQTDATASSSIWSEEWKASTSYATTTSGLFSVLLGTYSSLSGVNFNQTSLYLQVDYDPGCNDTYEEVFTPRKRLGAVPAAFEAAKLGGYTWASPGAIGLTTASSSAFTTLTVSATSTFSANVGIGTSTPAYKLDVVGDLRVTSTSTFSGNVGIGTVNPSQKLDLVGSLELENTTTSSTGVIYKGANRFIHNFSHPTGDTAVPAGYNTFVGELAGNFTMGSTATSTDHASYNTGIGYYALQANTTGYSNSAMGYYALLSNTTGLANSAMGYAALYSNTTGYRNSAMGYGALYSNNTGYYNSAMGMYALFSNTAGFSNSAMGYAALYYNTTSTYNTAVGSYAGFGVSGNSFDNNSLFGYAAGYALTTGSSNVFLGLSAGRNQTTNSNLLIIDNQNRTSAALEATNALIYGTFAAAPANQILTINANVGIGTSTPAYKLDVVGDLRVTSTSTFSGNVILANALSAAYGGTGLTSFTKGDLLVGSSTTVLANLIVGANGKVLTASSTASYGLSWEAVSGSGITYLNGLSATTQYFATSTTGTTFGFSSSSATHTLSIPFATSTNYGLLTAADWTTFNSKISSQWTATSTGIYYNGGNVGIGTTGPGRKLDVLDASNPQLRLTNTGGSVYTEFSVAASTGDLTVSLYPNTTGNDVIFNMPGGTTGANLWVCQGDACPTTGWSLSNGGNLVVENAVYFPGSASGTTPFRIGPTGTDKELGVYDSATTTPILVFDEGT